MLFTKAWRAICELPLRMPSRIARCCCTVSDAVSVKGYFAHPSHFGWRSTDAVLAVALEQSRLDVARDLGADETYLAADPDLLAKLRAATSGHGPDIAVEVVGAQKSILTAVESVRRGGTVTLIGNLAPRVEIPLQTIVTRQLRLLGSCASAGEYGECIELMASGAINVHPLISAIAPLRDGAAWFDRLYHREPGLMKVILQP